MSRPLRIVAALLPIALTAVPACAQISLTTAVDLSLRNSPRVLSAQAEVARASAAVSEALDVYIPSVVGNGGVGDAWGFPIGAPTVFSITTQSLVFNFSQHDYIRSARSSLDAAQLTLLDARLAVAEDTAITCLALDRDAQRDAALQQEASFARELIEIVQSRLDAGQDTPIGLTTARLSSANISLAVLRASDETDTDRLHLAHLIGLPPGGLSLAHEDLATLPSASTSAVVSTTVPEPPAVRAAYALAKAKSEIAFGDSRYLYRPQATFAAYYNRLSPYANYQQFYGGSNRPFDYNASGFGVQITLPVFDVGHKAKARGSAADATHALREAEIARDQAGEGRLRLQRTTVELATRAEIATLEQQLAQQQLDVLRVQLQSGNPNGPEMTPKDERNSLIAEREKFLSVLDATLQLRQAQINLLRLTGQLEPWLKSLASSPNPPRP